MKCIYWTALAAVDLCRELLVFHDFKTGVASTTLLDSVHDRMLSETGILTAFRHLDVYFRFHRLTVWPTATAQNDLNILAIAKLISFLRNPSDTFSSLSPPAGALRSTANLPVLLLSLVPTVTASAFVFTLSRLEPAIFVQSHAAMTSNVVGSLSEVVTLLISDHLCFPSVSSPDSWASRIIYCSTECCARRGDKCNSDKWRRPL